MEEERHAERLAIPFRHHRLGARPLAEHRLVQQRLGRDDLVGLALELGELAHEAQDGRDILGSREPQDQTHIAASTSDIWPRPRAAITHPVMINAAPASVKGDTVSPNMMKPNKTAQRNEVYSVGAR